MDRLPTVLSKVPLSGRIASRNV